MGSHHLFNVLAPRALTRRYSSCYLEVDSVDNLLKAWHLCLLDACTHWGCPWCAMAPVEQSLATSMAMATHLWVAHPGQVEAALWTMAPPVRPRIPNPDEQPPASPWTADYLENRNLPPIQPRIYHHAIPLQDP